MGNDACMNDGADVVLLLQSRYLPPVHRQPDRQHAQAELESYQHDSLKQYLRQQHPAEQDRVEQDLVEVEQDPVEQDLVEVEEDPVEQDPVEQDPMEQDPVEQDYAELSQEDPME